MRSVCISKVKAALPDLLRLAEHGEEIQITRHGRPIARLVPEPVTDRTELETLIAEMRSFRKGRRLGGDLTIRDLIGHSVSL